MSGELCEVNVDEVRRAFPTTPLGREQLWVRVEQREVDDSEDGRSRLVGVASVFDQRAKVRLPDGRIVHEEVAPSAFNNTLNRSDIFLLWQHDMATPLARTGAGNLNLRVTELGLEYEATLPDTQAARDAAVLVRSGVVNKMSFGFTVPPGGDKITVRNDGSLVRTLHDVRLWEVSLVSAPAYSGTSAAVRSDAFGMLCRQFGLDEAAVLDGLTAADAVDDVRDADSGIVGVSTASLRSVPGAVTTSETVDRAGTTDQTGHLTRRMWAHRLSEQGARFNAPRIS